jgi:formate C-acetyltransferase
MRFEQWEDFNNGDWEDEIDVRNFIQLNYTPYFGDGVFLKCPTLNTQKLWGKVLELYKKEKEKNGVLSIDAETISTISSHKARIY